VSIPNPHPITEKLRDSGLVEAAVFPSTVQAPELINECITHYNPETKQIVLPNDDVLLSIDWETIVSFLRIPE
jgi:hypothetical protein